MIDLRSIDDKLRQADALLRGNNGPSKDCIGAAIILIAEARERLRDVALELCDGKRP